MCRCGKLSAAHGRFGRRCAGKGQLRLRFEAARTQSPLFDSTAFARYLEMGYDMAYARWQAGLPPADIAVGAG
jgi:hypothetical protein